MVVPISFWSVRVHKNPSVDMCQKCDTMNHLVLSELLQRGDALRKCKSSPKDALCRKG